MNQNIPTIRLTGVADIAAAIPALLGYIPAEALVCICLTTTPDGRRTVGPLLASPLPAAPAASPFDDVRAVIPTLRSVVATNAVEQIVLAAVTGNPGWDPFIQTLADVLQGTAADVLDVLRIDGGMVSSYLHPETGPVAYDHAPSTGQLNAAMALSGRRVMNSRDALIHAIDPAHTGQPLGTDQLNDATETMARIGQHHLQDLTAAAAHLYARMVGLAAGGHGLPEDEAADLVAALALSTTVRDHLITLAVRDAATGDANAAVNALTQLLGRTPNHYAPETGILLALTAYRSGDGALANVALDRVLSVDPTHRLGQLFCSVITSGLPPATLDTLVRA